MIGKVVKYLSGVKHETSKVIWPSRQQLQGSAVVVISMSLVLAAFIFGIDIILNNILKIVL